MLETIYVARHGFRSNWTTDNDGNYSATITSPTGIASDPPLAAYGVEQAHELATYAASVDPKIERIYSSPFYRCLETINPLAEILDLPILCDNGIGEWYGVARFDHPSPAAPEILHRFFPRVRTSYDPTIIPSTKGETLSEIHNRTAYACAKIISDIDREWKETGTGPRAILLVAHAATNIAIGRVLTGDENREIRAGTCSMSIYRRRATTTPPAPNALPLPSTEDPIPDTNWRGGKGVVGGWDQIQNGDCSFLKNGEERNWWFEGDESWDFPVVKEGTAGVEGGLTAAIEGGLTEGAIGGPGTLPEAGKAEDTAHMHKVEKQRSNI
ncbi:histidine phosphatase superfamily [Tricharina praecox]|uniref:histidine phosphatase superfamily n=1 Tax=Tricharina praecox TaxID=43433 RepID=UPI00221E8F3E|nr:histidine phosphatase superfamily [Tricharina praecox]KAI5850135.1 histidine phosphatase superfamily [Tricharina praecox]